MQRPSCANGSLRKCPLNGKVALHGALSENAGCVGKADPPVEVHISAMWCSDDEDRLDADNSEASAGGISMLLTGSGKADGPESGAVTSWAVESGHVELSDSSQRLKSASDIVEGSAWC